MTLCLTKTIRANMNNQAFTLLEMTIAIAFTVLLMAGVYGFYTTSSQVYSAGISGQGLQDAANIVLNKITEGETESGTTYRLSTAVSYMIPNGNSSYLYYCQDTLCTASDPTARWYYLSGTSVMYHHFGTSGGTVTETIYQAPKGSTLKLRFSPAAVNAPANIVEIDVDLTANLASNITNSRLATSGDVSTFVLLRNHS